jgi:hypothetical protein
LEEQIATTYDRLDWKSKLRPLIDWKNKFSSSGISIQFVGELQQDLDAMKGLKEGKY